MKAEHQFFQASGKDKDGNYIYIHFKYGSLEVYKTKNKNDLIDDKNIILEIDLK